jgi:hypothetical protein
MCAWNKGKALRYTTTHREPLHLVKNSFLIHITQESFTGYIVCASNLISWLTWSWGNSIYPRAYSKKTRLIYLSWIWRWSPLRACAYHLGCKKCLLFGFNFWDDYWGLGWHSTSFIFFTSRWHLNLSLSRAMQAVRQLLIVIKDFLLF